MGEKRPAEKWRKCIDQKSYPPLDAKPALCGQGVGQEKM